jgi:hypothetical protein
MCHPSEMSLHNLVGKSRGHRGLLDIILFKMDVLHDWLTDKMDACRLSTRCKSTIRTRMTDFATYHASNDDCTWRAQLLQSGRKFADLLEAW